MERLILCLTLLGYGQIACSISSARSDALKEVGMAGQVTNESGKDKKVVKQSKMVKKGEEAQSIKFPVEPETSENLEYRYICESNGSWRGLSVIKRKDGTFEVVYYKVVNNVVVRRPVIILRSLYMANKHANKILSSFKDAKFVCRLEKQ